MGGSVAATSSGLQLSSSLAKPAAGVGIGAGALSAGLALAGIRANRKARAAASISNPTCWLNSSTQTPLPNSRYPETIWTFLNQASSTGQAGLSRKQQLLQTWVQVNRIDSLDITPKIARLTSEPSQGLPLTIDDFEDRSAMLQDVRARISYLTRDLGKLLIELPAVAE